MKVFGRLRGGELCCVEFGVKAWSFGKGLSSDHVIQIEIRVLTQKSSSFVVQGAMLGIRIRFKVLLSCERNMGAHGRTWSKKTASWWNMAIGYQRCYFAL